MERINIYAADIGSVKKNNFGWAKREFASKRITSEENINNFVRNINNDINNGLKVSIGFECPLFINLPKNPLELTCARKGEGSRAWSAGAGSGALATGLIEVLWILCEIKQNTKVELNPTFSINELIDGKANLHIWEAFVTSNSKGLSHCNDAEIAVMEYIKRLENNLLFTDVSVDNPYSLVGAALLRSGITNKIDILNQSCIVIKA